MNSSRMRIKRLSVSLFKIVFILPAIIFSSFAVYAADLDLEKDIQGKLEQSKKIVETARAKQKSGKATIQEAKLLRSLAEDVTASDMLFKERFKVREQKVKSLNSKAVNRHQTAAEGYAKALKQYLSLISTIPTDGPIPNRTLNKLETLLEKIVHKKTRPIIGSLPYKHLNYTVKEPITSPTVTPAYRGGNSMVNSEDTQATVEAPISSEIVTLAQSLNWNPVLIYEYVKNNIETEWYFGCMKGAEDTLHQNSGNDCDQATLFAALLRASGYPTRYIRGAIEFFPDIEKAKNLTGVSDPAKLGEFFQNAGIPFHVVMDGTTVKNIQIDHIFVETMVPYSNYRGAIMDSQGQTWIALDTAIKAGGYTENQAGDILSEMSLTNMRDDYLSATQTGTPLEYLTARVNQHLLQTSPTKTYTDYLSTRTLNPQVMQILPSSLQFKEIAITGESTAIPSELIHKVNFLAKDSNNNELFNITLDTFKLSNHKIIISYEPESVDDQEIINSFGSLDNTPAYLVRLRPDLMLDDERIAVGTDGVAMGGDYGITISVVSPNGTENVTNSMIAGNMTAIGIASQNAVVPGVIDQAKAADLLSQEALRYIDNWNKSENELAQLVRVSLSRPLPTVVTLANIIDVTYLDQPQGFEWKGLFLDADLRAVEAVNRTLTPDNRTLTFTQLSVLQGSFLESKLFEDAFGVESISTAKLISLANGSQLATTVLTIGQSNIAAILPTLSFDDNIKQDITTAVSQNSAIRIPQSEVTYMDWTGIGYIKENTTTGEAGYMLSGMVAGGMTAVSPSTWTSSPFVSVLSHPYKDTNKRITILSPQNESIVAQSSVDVTGIVLDPGSTVTVNGIAAEMTGNTFTAYGVKLSPWTNVISAVSTTAGQTTSDTVFVTCKLPLSVSVTFPLDGTVLSISPIFIEGTVGDPTADVSVNGIAATVLSDGRFTATGVQIYEGSNSVTVTAVNRVGEQSTQTISLTYQPIQPKPSLSISITTPANNGTVNNQTTAVSGTVASTAQEMSIRVNGVFAEIYNGQFTANNVPLGEGNNVIIADALDANNAIARTQISVTANTTIPSVTLSSNIQSGVAPLTTYFSISSTITTSITGYSLDFGDNTAAYTGVAFDSVSHSYNTEGIFHPVVTISDDQGNTYTGSTTITIQNRPSFNSILTNIWNEMKAKLSDQDINGALAFFVPWSQDRYREVFTALRAKLPQMVQNMHDIQLIYARNGIAKYRITKDESYAGQMVTITYYIYFTRDTNGIWKIEKF